MDYLNISAYGQKPLEKTQDILVLSRTRASGPFSFIPSNYSIYEDQRPPPVFLSIADLNRPKTFGIAQIKEDFIIKSTGELKLTNESLKEKQKGVISEVLKSLASLMLNGKSFVNLSLPIRIFEPRTQMERLCDFYHFFPHYLEIAAKTKDPRERVKLVLTSLFAAIHHCLSQLKPFNPLMGETYIGKIGPNTQLYLEHISHHPPISAFLLVNPHFRVHGKWKFDAKLGANKFEPINHGFMTVEFNDGMKIKCVMPLAQINGTVIGERTLRFIHSFFAFEEGSQIKGVISFADGKNGKNFLKSMFSSKGRIDLVSGKIYTYDHAIHEKLLGESWHQMLKKSGKMSDLVSTICSIQGCWLEELMFDEKVYWNLERDQVFALQQKVGNNPLPSDFRFREDLVWLFYGNEKYAQEWKLILEARQRAERKMRMDYYSLVGKSQW